MLEKHYRHINADVDARQNFIAGSVLRNIACAHPVLVVHCAATVGTTLCSQKSSALSPPHARQRRSHTAIEPHGAT